MPTNLSVESSHTVVSPKFFRDAEDRTALTDSPTKQTFSDQMNRVKQIIRKEQLINEKRIDYEVEYYYGNLGLSTNYFELHTAEEIAKHVGSLYAAKNLAYINQSTMELELKNQSEGRVVFLAHSVPGSRHSPSQHIEYHIEQNFLGEGYKQSSMDIVSTDRLGVQYSIGSNTSGPSGPSSAVPNSSTKELRYNLLCFRTKGTVSPDSDVHLRMYLLSEPKYQNPNPAKNEVDLQLIADQDFLRTASVERQTLYQELIKEAVNRMGPVIRVLDTSLELTKHLVIAYRSGSTHSFFSGITALYHSHGLYSPRKYIEQFSNGITVFDIQLYPIKPENELTAEKAKVMIEEANLVYILPRTSLTPLFREGVLSAKEYAYAYAGWKFAFHFLSRQSVEFSELAALLQRQNNGNDAGMLLHLSKIRNMVRKETYSEARVLEAVFAQAALLPELYRDFERRCRTLPGTPRGDLEDPGLLGRIQRAPVASELDRQVLGAFLTFNRHVLRTNFFQHTKVALAFRLDPACLTAVDYPKTPFGLFFLVGPEFRGFHVRFRDIARGGIRIIRSGNLQAFLQNVSTVLDENYNLAATQERKNKDIAEGGAKGTILLSLDHQDKAFEAFKKYVDALLDLLLLPNPSIVDHYGKEEILFLGPDEGTASYMDWASHHAYERGYKFWKSFTTGKSRERGGIPHDLYGMTTRSIHQYVVGALEKLGLDESKVKKFQTGGPDGDLGSNEIKISKDQTIAIVDGSGVLYDPEGLDRRELGRLAGDRLLARHFDRSHLSARGFFVDVEANDLGTLSQDLGTLTGLELRNGFHLHALAASDIFVPCGGRPESIHVHNVQQLIDPESKRPRWRLIVEGANLFLTQEARLFLEQHGVIIFKDASANKGGVTSSSLEVLAALSLTDEEFATHMCVCDGQEPKFYKEYVADVQATIESNARLEFECLWEENRRSGIARSILSDTISNKINELSLSIGQSDLWENVALRTKVLSVACPKTLIALLGLEKILQRVPVNYIRAVFGCYLASRYVYSCGLASNPEFSFYTFISKFTSNLS